ncbi:cap-specific mRNA (nucleoside-2'-O-)-methyltransferase 2-like [Mizuhopecten yessoensis]|uniref:Cap-specific mRNA (nucleoside-2'-O-)-methyltransferase 2 n=1 Tax=Mizuhopecten yessoensis TaxID=6573 RepID=A0A210QLX0_MIZYE|nr:cap-specific mRNA (nucleoside-2'-O-)-methyltransferase 2-like [Mizuhopecten yessoensis]XP_021354966.1 cap-specific mRNA (nucleoside-2'-O-)-methyltransferase 2-like [Mizuhopecten yessoensis]OWF49722.1 FtsJ methyltransferase domain-containing protein 1 [Mizuhopecten yessoensis]
MTSQRKRKISGSSSLQADPASKKRVEKLFQKKFSYSPNSNKSKYAPPSLSIACECGEWLIEETQQMKVNLNAVKDKLSDKDISLWHAHTGQMNLAGTVISELRENFKPELCTQAWCKFYEIVSTFKLIDFGNPEFNSVHLCEAPGAFITSLNHYLISHDYQGTWTWFGNTLNPYYEGNNVSQMIADDRFILHSLPYWDFGADGTGNLMDWDNLQQLAATCQKMAPIHLVTCDGSIDCQDTPGDQEAVVSRLHCSEALAAMTILSPGGSLVLKKFTMFECETVCLLYLLNCAFDQVEVFKPATSKSGNSEVYVIGTGFHGNSTIAGLTDYVKHYFQNGAVQMLFRRECIPDTFVSEHVACCEMFTSLQRETICNNLDHYPSVSEQYVLWLETMRDYCAEMYITKFDLKQISVNCRIGHSYRKKRLSHSAQSFKNDYTPFDQKRRSGTFTDRHNSNELPWQQRVHHLDRYNVKPPKIIWCQFEAFLEDMDGEDCSCGKPVSRLINSRFCDGKLIQQMQELIQNAKDYRNSLHAPPLSSVSHALDGLTHDCEESTGSECERSEVTEEKSDYTVVLLSDETPSSDDDKWEDPRISKVLHMGLTSVKSPDEDDNIIFYVDITTDKYCGEMEILSQCTLLSWTHTLLKKLKMADSLIVRMSTCLTRFTAGIVYMMGHSFSRIGFLQDTDGTRVQQLLICEEYAGGPVRVLKQLDAIQEKLENIGKESIPQTSTMDSERESDVQSEMETRAECNSTFQDEREKISSGSKLTLMETVPLTILLQDSLFVASLCHSNATLLRSFVRMVGDRERELYPMETQPDRLE